MLYYLAFTVTANPIHSKIAAISTEAPSFLRATVLSPVPPGNYSVVVRTNSILGSSKWSQPRNVTVGRFLYEIL